MKRQRTNGIRALSTFHTILLLGKDQERLKTIARKVAAPDRVVMMARSKEAVRSAFTFEDVGLAIVDVDNAADLTTVIPSLKRKRTMPLVLLRDEQPSPKAYRSGSRKCPVSTITKPVSPPFLEREIAQLLH